MDDNDYRPPVAKTGLLAAAIVGGLAVVIGLVVYLATRQTGGNWLDSYAGGVLFLTICSLPVFVMAWEMDKLIRPIRRALYKIVNKINRDLPD